MFISEPNQGFNPEQGTGMRMFPPDTLDGFAAGETAEALVCLEEHLLHEALIEMCVQRAAESSSGYSAAYHVSMLRRQGLFSDPFKGYEELDRYQRNNAYRTKAGD